MSHERTGLRVDVRELVEHGGSPKTLRVREAVPGLEVDLARVPSDVPVEVDVSLEVMEGGILVRGAVTGRYRVTCRRCLSESDVDFAQSVSEVYRPPSDVWEEGYVIADDQVDLRPLVRDNVVLALPQNPLCRPDCAGLCASCGADRNDAPCGCPSDEGDTRWSALRDLLPDGG